GQHRRLPGRARRPARRPRRLLRPFRRPHGAHLHHPEAPGRRAAAVPRQRRRPRRRPDLGDLPAQPARLLGGQRARPLRPAAPAGPAPARPRAAAGDAEPGLRDGRLVRDQHELAVLRRRGHPRPRRAGAGAGGAELPQRRGGPRGRRGAGARLHPDPHRPDRQLLGRPRPGRDPGPAAALTRRGRPAHGRRRGAEPLRRPDGHDPGRRRADDRRGSGGQPGGHQARRDERWRLLQRQLRPPVREPQPGDELPGGPPPPAHPRGADPHLRHHGRRPAPGPGDPRRHGRGLRHLARGDHRLRGGPPRHGAAGRGRLAGGQGGALRRRAVGAVRHGDHHDVHRRRELLPRQLHRHRRRHADPQHDVRRGHARWRRRRALRGPRHRHPRRLPRRADGRPHPGVPAEEDRQPGDRARRPVRPRHPDRAARGPGHRRVAALLPGGLHQQRRPRVQRGAVRLHLGQQQQRQRLRGHHHRHHLRQHRARAVHARRALPADRLRAGAGRQPGPPDADAAVGGHPAHALGPLRHPRGRGARHRHRSHVLPGARARTPRRRPHHRVRSTLM
ncbi:MAG: Potassium-transporting ATPase A chain, partial [uncultured Pseudonocardia sp.]